MDNREKEFYHQIHPAKLATDIATSVVSLYLFWGGELLGGIVVTIVFPPAASVMVIRFADLERLKNSAAGAYLAHHMGPAVQGIRLAGALVMIVGAWYHLLWLLAAGLLVILMAWFHGLLPRGPPPRTP